MKHFKPVKRKYSFTKCLINIWNLLQPDTSEIRNLIRAQKDSKQTSIWMLVRFTDKNRETMKKQNIGGSIN